jgi:hypothetical protein
MNFNISGKSRAYSAIIGLLILQLLLTFVSLFNPPANVMLYGTGWFEPWRIDLITSLIFSLVILFFIVRQRRIGWYLLLVSSLVLAIYNAAYETFWLIMNDYYLFKSIKIEWFIMLLVRCILVVLLLHPQVVELFGISEKNKKKTMIISISLVLLIIIYRFLPVIFPTRIL